MGTSVTSADRVIALQALTDDWLICRGYGHAWRVELSAGARVPRRLLKEVAAELPAAAREAVERTADHGGQVIHGSWRTMFKRCTRSGSTVLQLIDRGEVVYEHRTWPDGYLLPAGMAEGEHYIIEAQEELWRRAIERDSEVATLTAI